MNCKSLAYILQRKKDPKLQIIIETEDPAAIKFFFDCDGDGSLLYNFYTTDLPDLEMDIPVRNSILLVLTSFIVTLRSTNVT